MHCRHQTLPSCASRLMQCTVAMEELSGGARPLWNNISSIRARASCMQNRSQYTDEVMDNSLTVLSYGEYNGYAGKGVRRTMQDVE